MEETQSNCVKKKDDDVICTSPVSGRVPIKKMKQARLPFMPLEQKPYRVKEDCSPSKKRKLSDAESSAQKSKIQKSSTHLDKLSSDDYLDTSSGSETENLPSINNMPRELQQSNTISKYLKENSRAIVLVKPLDEKTLHQTIERVREESRGSNCDNTPVIDLTNSDSQHAFEKGENVTVLDEKETSCDKNVAESNVRNKTVCNNTSDGEMDVSLEDIDAVRESEENLSSSPESKENDQTSSPEESNKISHSSGKTPVCDRKINCDDTPCSLDAQEKSKTTPKSRRKTEKELALIEARRKEKDMLRQKQKEEKEREKEEKKQQKEKEKIEKEKEKEREKEEKRKQKDEQKAEKDRQKREEKEKKEKEKQEKQQQKEEEQRKKQEILDAKNEEKRKKEEEKKMKEEEKLKEEEEKTRKQERIKAAFSGFFIKQNSPPSKTEKSVTKLFMPFELKKDMVLADRLPRQPLSDNLKVQLKEHIEKQECRCHYLMELKEKRHKPFRQSLSIRNKFCEEDIVVTGHDSETVKKVTYHIKFLKFHENTRPAYYGTWRKASKVLNPRKPFKQDETLFDYAVDSDDEWEEEEPGESLSDSEGENEKEDDDEEEGDGWMVPHGYLSEDEGIEDDEPVTPELLKARQMAKASAWERELKRQTTPVATICIGLFWENSAEVDVDTMQKLSKYQGVCIMDQPIPTKLSRKHLDLTNEGLDRQSPITPKGPQKKPVPEEAMSDLVRLVHGSLSGIKKLIKEFRAYWKQKTTGVMTQEQGNNSMEVDEEDDDESGKKNKVKENKSEQSFTENETNTESDDYSISKRQLEIKIMSIAVREKRQGYKKICWYVHKDVQKQYNCENLVFPNNWDYVTKTAKTPAPKEKIKQEEITTPGRKTPTILQFVQPMSPSQIALTSTPANKDRDEKPTGSAKKTPNILKFMSPQSSTPIPTAKNDDLKLTTPKACKKPVSLFTSPSPTSSVNVEKTDKTSSVQPKSKIDVIDDQSDCLISDSKNISNNQRSITDFGIKEINHIKEKVDSDQMEVSSNNNTSVGQSPSTSENKSTEPKSSVINDVIVLD